MSDWCLSIVRRWRDDKQTGGRGFVLDPALDVRFRFYALELPWKDNENEISCIPAGQYPIKKRWSPKYGWHFIVENVPGRSYILIHFGNYYYNTRGCILPGEKFTDINHDGYRDVTSSKPTMDELLRLLPETATLVISERFRDAA